MYILGVSGHYHDSAATLVKDGKVVMAIEEERLSRKKHDPGFPSLAIKHCLESEGITAKDLDYVAFYEKPLLKFERILYQHIDTWPVSWHSFCTGLPGWLKEKLHVKRLLRKEIGYTGKVFFPEHHLSHASSAFLVSPFKEAAIMTMDGVGEWTTTTLGLGKGNEVQLLKEIRFPHSLGLLYSAMTAYLGFKVNDHEYKVMGLSAYGDPEPYYDAVRKMIRVKEDGSYELDLSYFAFTYSDRMPSPKMIKELGPARRKGDKMGKRYEDIAAALQKVLEEVLFESLNGLHKVTRQENLVMSGGVALNSLANGKILKKTGFEEMYMQPACSDAGNSMGAAFYVYNTLLENKRSYVLRDPFLGPEYSRDYIKSFLDREKVKYTEYQDSKKLVKDTAKLLTEEKIIGWFQDRMEWGPRALGNRSILASPLTDKMKDILNAKVKHRELFRPFAPVVPVEDARDWFETDDPVPLPADFMLMVYPIRKEKRKLVPAVTHVDGTGRLQTIRREQNQKYYDVIKEFGRLTGVPILVNTSFNIRGEPIVCKPEEAYRCVMGTGIDYLALGDFLIARSDNPQHMWDSENLSDVLDFK